LGCDNNSSLTFTLIIQCFIVLKLIVFIGNIRKKSGPVDRVCFFPDGVILFQVKFIKKLSNGLIGVHLIVPPNFSNSEIQKIQNCIVRETLRFCRENEVKSFYTGHRSIWTKSGPVDRLCFFPDDVILNFFRVKFIKKLSNGLIDIYLIVPSNFKIKIVLSGKL
jgi:hypothetical protein